MKSSPRTTPIWPYVGLVLCLFLLTIVASTAWVKLTAPEVRKTVEFDTRPFDAADVIDIPPPVSAEREAGSVNPFELAEFEAPRQVVQAAPPVAAKVESHLPLTETRLSTRTMAPVLSQPVKKRSTTTHVMIQVAAPPALVERSAVESTSAVSRGWPLAESLVAQLEELAATAETGLWANTTLQVLHRIDRIDSLASTEIPALLGQLESQSAQAKGMAAAASTETLRSSLLRAAYSIKRRVVIWRQVNRLATLVPEANSGPDPASIAKTVAAVKSRLAGNAHAAAWNEYLLLDDPRAGSASNTAARRQWARRVLARLESNQLSPKQAALLQQPPFDDFAKQLRRWSNEPLDYVALLNDLEAFESSGAAEDARRIARTYQTARWSTNEQIVELANLLDLHYRNANVRIAVADELLNRLLPPQETIDEEVQEEIQGADVRGVSRTSTRLRVVLVPDDQQWRVGLEADGEFESETSATQGPATFYNEGFGKYLARKLLLVDRREVRARRAEAEAETENDLVGFHTDFDRIPILGWIARAIAQQQHDDRSYDAEREARLILESRASSRLDQEVQMRLDDARKKFKTQLITPLRDLDLDPVAVALQTTDRRLIARYRLAGEGQLAGYTSRPMAPGDSLLSVQIHESMFNNTLEQLGLEGQRSDLRTLYRELADTFERRDLEVPDDIPDRVTIQFADKDAVRVRCDNGRVTVTLRIAELKSRRQSWRNFTVRAYYAPDTQQLHGNLVRDGVIELIGDRLGTGDQVALRFIFSTVLSKNRPVNIINSTLAENPKLADLQVNQFVVDKGWIGVALGPQRGQTTIHLADEPTAARRQ